jgi:hypothetical protein
LRPLVLSLGLALVAAGASACKHPGSAKLEGHWKGQSAVGIGPENQINANVYAAGTEIIARGNQITISSPAARNVTATYVVDKEDATSVVIHTDKDNTTETFIFTEPKTMQWKVDERRSIVFKKLD